MTEVLSYRNQVNELQNKSLDCFLYDRTSIMKELNNSIIISLTCWFVFYYSCKSKKLNSLRSDFPEILSFKNSPKLVGFVDIACFHDESWLSSEWSLITHANFIQKYFHDSSIVKWGNQDSLSLFIYFFYVTPISLCAHKKLLPLLFSVSLFLFY